MPKTFLYHHSVTWDTSQIMCQTVKNDYSRNTYCGIKSWSSIRHNGLILVITEALFKSFYFNTLSEYFKDVAYGILPAWLTLSSALRSPVKFYFLCSFLRTGRETNLRIAVFHHLLLIIILFHIDIHFLYGVTYFSFRDILLFHLEFLVNLINSLRPQYRHKVLIDFASPSSLCLSWLVSFITGAYSPNTDFTDF